MGIFDRVERSALQAVSYTNPTDDFWYKKLDGYGDTHAGFPIGPESALKVSAFFACNSLIAETVASVPCLLYRRTDDKGSKERARDHRWYKVVRQRPNRRDTPMNFFGDGQMRLGSRGGALAEVLDDGERGELLPLHPDYTTLELTPSGLYRYRIRDPYNPSAEPRLLLQNRVLHVRDLSTDNFRGLQRLHLAREAIAVQAAAEGYVGRFFKNDASGRLVIEHPTALTEEQKQAWRTMMAENVEGWSNARKYLHTHSGVKISELGKQNDSEFLVEPRREQVAEIARFYRVPLFMIGLEEKSTTWGTGIEQQVQGFITFTVRSWAKRWQEALGQALLDDDEQEEYFFEFLFSDLVVGDLMTRMQAYQIGRNLAMYTPNDLLRKENEPPRTDPGGNEYQDTPAGAPPNARPAGRTSPPLGEDDEDEDNEPEARVIPAPLLADAVHRIASREIDDVGRRAARATDPKDPKFSLWLTKYYAAHRDYVVKVLTPLGEAFGFEHWILEEAALSVERSTEGLTAAAVPDFLARRKSEIAEIFTEAFSAPARSEEA